MKKFFLYSATLLMLSPFIISCSKSADAPATAPVVTYTAGQGKITGTGSSTFSVTGAASIFSKKVDTIAIQANIDPTANVGKQFIMAMVAKTPGTYNFVDATGNPGGNYTSGAIGYYGYETVNGSGTVIAHQFISKSGTFTITSVSASAVNGSYTVTLNDFNNNGDAPVTISGTFTGNF